MQNHDFSLYYIPATHLHFLKNCNQRYRLVLTILNKGHKYDLFIIPYDRVDKKISTVFLHLEINIQYTSEHFKNATLMSLFIPLPNLMLFHSPTSSELYFVPPLTSPIHTSHVCPCFLSCYAQHLTYEKDI